MRKSRPYVVSHHEELEKLILEYIGFNHAYSMNELFNRFCIRSAGVRVVYTKDELDQVLSRLIEDEKLTDTGNGWFVRPRPTTQEMTEEDLVYRSS